MNKHHFMRAAMKDISISVTYMRDDEHDNLTQIHEIQSRFVPHGICVMDISFEKEWLPTRTKITFKGVEK